jgi:predicted DNA-binding ribbon-helix-helix protein
MGAVRQFAFLGPAPLWCKVVQIVEDAQLPAKRQSLKHVIKTTRASVSFPTGVYQELERIAAAKKVSLAWIVREATEKYVADQWPLFQHTREPAQ